MKEFLNVINDYTESEKPERALCIFFNDEKGLSIRTTESFTLHDLMEAIVALAQQSYKADRESIVDIEEEIKKIKEK